MFVIASAVLAAASQAKSPTQRVQIAGTALPAVQSARVIGAADSSMPIHMSVGLNPRFPDELKAFCDSVSNPLSPNYLHFMTPAQVGENFGASATDVNNVVSYLKSQGIKVDLVAPNRMAILCEGTVGQAQTAFGTKINWYQESRSGQPFKFVANATAVTVPSNIARTIQVVGGLDSYARPIPRTTLTPVLARGLYNTAPSYANGYQGQGRKVGYSNWDDFSIVDAETFITTFGLPIPNGGLGSNLHIVVVDYADSSTVGDVEGNLDMQMELAAAPLADLYVYDNGPNPMNGGIDPLGLYTKEASDNLCDVISESYGWAAAEISAAYANSCHNQHLSMTAQGQTYLVASGDNGTEDMWLPTFNGNFPDPLPDCDPEVTNVGGTIATVNTTTGARISEVGWSGSGGGWYKANSGSNPTYTFNTLPSWQTGNGVPTGINFRLVPDISLQGGDTWSMVLGGSINTGWEGTSFATPFCAGCLTTMEQRLAALNFSSGGILGRLGRINDMIYQENGRSDVWYDVTSGNSSNPYLPNGQQAVATAGWDFVTGWGAPNFDAWFTAISTRTIAGTVTLQNYPPGPNGVSVTVQLYKAGTGTLVDTKTATLNSSGSFSISSQAPIASYDVYVKASHWLRRKLTNQTFGTGALSGLSFSLLNGDVNGDNSVSLADFGQLKLAYGSTPSSGNWNPNADLDGNGSVGLSDFGILKLNYGKGGD